MKSKLCAKNPENIASNAMLSMIIETGMSYKDYSKWQKMFKNHNVDICPKQRDIAYAKLQCYPENLIFSETKAECPLKELLQHTAKRILEANIKPDFASECNENKCTGTLICK